MHIPVDAIRSGQNNVHGGIRVSIVNLDAVVTHSVMDVGHAVVWRMHLPLLGNFQHQIMAFRTVLIVAKG
jgi:hypothetical protein